MSKDDLENRKAAIQVRFDELANTKVNVEDEMRRLEGEHRLIVELLEAVEPGGDNNKRMRKVLDAKD